MTPPNPKLRSNQEFDITFLREANGEIIAEK